MTWKRYSSRLSLFGLNLLNQSHLHLPEKKKITIVWRSDRTASLLSPNAPLLVPSDLVLVRRTRERTRACAFLKLTKLVLDQWRSARLVFGGALNG